MAQMGVSPRFLVGVVLAVLTVCVLVFHFSDADASSKPRAPKVHYIECAPGGVHAWVSEDGGVAVLPAGSDCP